MNKQKRINWLKDRISSMEQCRDEMPFGLSEDESMELSAYKDSLASLTAVPFGWEIAGNIFPTLEEALKPGYIGTPEPIYDEPPVPEINTSSELTALLNAVESFKVVKASDKWNESGKWDNAYDKLSEAAIKAAPLIKRLNGSGE